MIFLIFISGDQSSPKRENISTRPLLLKRGKSIGVLNFIFGALKG